MKDEILEIPKDAYASQVTIDACVLEHAAGKKQPMPGYRITVYSLTEKDEKGKPKVIGRHVAPMSTEHARQLALDLIEIAAVIDFTSKEDAVKEEVDKILGDLEIEH